MQNTTFYVTDKYLKTSLMLFPIFAYTKNFLEGAIISIWISLCILLPAIITKQIKLKNQILIIYLFIIGIFVSLTYLFMYYVTPILYENLRFSIPILIVIIVSFHKNEPFKNLQDQSNIFQYSKLPIITFISLSTTISLFREILNTGGLQFFNLKLLIIKDSDIIKTPAYSSNVFLVASLIFLLINILISIKGKKND
ncbi:hypothetical protein BmHG_00605 [Borrelia miyamotoi]|uniref:Uncharacterized protein n=1 Tax=Borrelia miyamotoi TaxID=47466 RepID=A0AAP8YRK5_9SPIR|nr:hypothetical protein [Borrelia miyamotoi]AHH04819.1 Hypothetical protein BOM_0276 [Borrelia miyamotoi FR64b]ATQ14651.1 hypothetical protein CNO14_01315 [Borrelia miyamotoi]ATQ15835.1 hypothetical protein CNO13_01315 [Borrelia miyamotoi]ATQ16980.1 hypothetical protein CNO12_01315 [Borrelia miyamotoi]ATQ18516.1 hypothetical protein CNO11_02930 [Borrelia miyamotoi]